MASGMLFVSGTIDPLQFWPVGQSDADTTKIKVTVGGNAFQFQSHAGAPLTPTTVFDGAKVRGARGAVKPVRDKDGRITVRLQGIDAPELHYRPQSALSDPPKKPKAGVKYRSAAQKKLFLDINEEYRQWLAETATVQLRDFLSSFGSDPLPCRVVTAVDDPNEAFDTYGRLVGDIWVGPKDDDVNHWLVRQGWAVCAFYTSMSSTEIQTLTDLGDQAKTDKNGIWKNHYQARIGPLDWDLWYRRPKKDKPIQFVPSKDQGDVIFPKLFRRLTTWSVNHKAKMVTKSFKQYLAAQTADRAMLTAEVVAQGVAVATEYPLADFLQSGKFTVSPEGLVIKEKPSTLIPAPGRGLAW